MNNNLKTDWDLGFQSSNDGFHVLLNSSTFCALSHINNYSFFDTLTTSNLSWIWDNPNGNLDSSAFGDYRDKGGFFILDRGYNVNGNPRGFKKIKIDTLPELEQLMLHKLYNLNKILTKFTGASLFQDLEI